MSRLSAVLALPCAALALVAGLSFDGSFDLGAIWLVCVTCAVAPALITAAGSARKAGPVPLWLTLAVSLAGWAGGVPLLASKLAASGPGQAGGWLAILRMAVTDAPRQLLTIEPPVAATAVLLAGLGSLVWWAAAWSAEAAVRAAAVGRVSVMSALPGTVVLLAGTAAGVPRGSASLLWPAVAFVGAFSVLLAAERAVAGLLTTGLLTTGRIATRVAGSAGGGEGRLIAAGGRLALAVGTTAVITSAALLLVPVLPGLASRPPADPRQLIKPVSHVQPLIDPLGLVSEWLSEPPTELFTVRTADPVNLSWLVLDRYDGDQWSSTADYEPAGIVLPAEPGASGPSRRVAEQISVPPQSGLPGSWLPAADRPYRLSGAAARFDPASGMLATLEGTPVDGLSYRVSSLVPTLGLRQLENAVPGSGHAVDAERVLPAGLPATVAAYGSRAMANAGSPYQQMLLLQNGLLHDFRYNPRAAPGQSYGHLSIFVGRHHHAGGPGVFATLFAVLARHAGFASRIAVGFLPGRRIGTDLYVVTTADVLAWPQVYLRGLGWVPFYPLPKPGSGRSGAVIRPLGQPASRTTLNQRIARRGGGTGTHHARRTPGITVPRPRARARSASIALYLMGGLLAAAVCYLLAAATSRLVIRRRWRRHADPRRRVAGAWQEALSGLTAAGGVALTTLTPEEVVEHAVAVAGSDVQAPTSLLAGLANTALFSPVAPRADEAAAAGRAAAQVRRLAGRRTPIKARAAVLLKTRPPGSLAANRPRRS